MDQLYASIDNISRDQIRQLKSGFKNLDKNGDGKITVYEINDALMRQGAHIGER